MSYWIFKQSEQERYPDEHGRKYVYDNRHSVRVDEGDSFIYLDKRFGGYDFTGHGTVIDVQKRKPKVEESTQAEIKLIYTAEIGDFCQYDPSLDIALTRSEGKKNRTALGIKNVNKLGWSRSVTQISRDMYERIIDLACQRQCYAVTPIDGEDYIVRDDWSFVRRRHRVEQFKKAVLLRQGCACAICGTTLREVLDVAHISRYSTDKKNRANPANGIVLCTYCHRAFDGGVYRLHETGHVSVVYPDLDSVALAHVSSLSPEARLHLLNGIDTELLRQRLLEGI
ncbi:MAG: hypothetical protein F4Y80_06160 [Caldilineaceae bacterium SB0665_bin_21]|nr:hypothetical protein [Caldilineaceae bacterium SB0665_bin_21]